MQHMDEAHAECKPDCQTCPITLTDTLERMLGESSTIEGSQVTIGCMKIKLHELNGKENGRHDLWCYSKILTG